MVKLVFKYASVSAAVFVALYAGLLALLTTSFFQAHVVYLHAFQMTWFKDLDVPETFGFLRNQVAPFSIMSPSGESLYAWHIIPVEFFKLLRDDPDARLVLHLHGAAGTVGSGYRTPNYRALSAGQPNKIHVLTFDYRGFGRSRGSPSERGLVLDALAVVDWATSVAGIPPSRILIFGQSIGTAVSLAISEHFALLDPPVVFAGAVLVAPFADIPTLVATYRVAGLLPIWSPVARFPQLFKYLSTFIQDKWPSKDRVEEYIRANEANGMKYRLTLIHAEDDYDIPYHHTEVVFWHAINATLPRGISFDESEERKSESKTDLGAAGSVVEWRTENGVIREEILKTGLHDVIMGYPIITMAVMRMFGAADPSFK